MTTGRNDTLALDDEDRLPWLEPAYDAEDSDEVSLGRLGMLVLAGLLLIGVVVGGVWLARGHLGGEGEGELIKAPAEGYKIRAADADAKKFQGEGDASFATSEGLDRGARIDPSRLPEAPIVAGSAAKAPAADRSAAAAAAKKVETAVADRTGEKAGTPAASASPRTTGGAIQLGAYGNEALAKDAWSRFSKRFDYLAALSYSVEPVTVGGTKFYRLRAHAGKDAGTLCGKLKVAGESCLVVN